MLQESTKFYHQRSDISDELAKLLLQESSVIATVCTSPDGRILEANPAFTRLVGLNTATDLLAQYFQMGYLTDRADWSFWERALTMQRVTVKEMELRTAGEDTRIVAGDIWAISNTDGTVDRLIGAFVDITRTSRMDQAVQQSIRARAINSLASGLVHDFRNLQTVLVANLYLIAESVRHDPRLFEQARRARDAAERGAELATQVLSLAHDDNLQTRTLDVGAVLSGLMTLLERAVGPQIRLKASIEAGLPAIEANAGLLEGVIINLVFNARDAIGSKGTIDLCASSRDLVAPECEQIGLEPGRYVCLTVTDDGAGIPCAIQTSVFDPFVSSKRDCGGSGLGLSMVRWFADSSGGAVTLTSAPDRGTVATLFFPTITAPSEEPEALTMPPGRLPGGDETIVVVSSEPILSETLDDELSALGYCIESSTKPLEIKRLLSDRIFPLVIVYSSTRRVADDGDLIQQIQAWNATSIILQIDDPDSDKPMLPTHVYRLPIPFSLKELATTVRAALDGRSDA